MLLFAGLGNPGRKYAHNRHNIGFMAADAVARVHGFVPWRAKFEGEIAEGRIAEERIMALKPMTFMNNSGQSVGQALRFYKLEPERLVVFHDEIDLVAGKVKVKKGGGNAGHNGLRDIDAHIGPDYWRVRLGVGRPEDRDHVIHHVLDDFSADDRDWLEPLLAALAQAAPHLVRLDDNGFMNAVLRASAPAKGAPHGV